MNLNLEEAAMSEHDGLIRAYRLDGEFDGKVLAWEGLRETWSDEGIVWGHLNCERRAGPVVNPGEERARCDHRRWALGGRDPAENGGT
jgi:hypothetical protein